MCEMLPSIDAHTLQVRKALAERLKLEVIGLQE